jgi:hypothetical protein
MNLEGVDRMTMQMILKARDGYLLASDRQMIDEQATRTAMHTEKIIDLPAQRVAYMASGDECALRAANDLADAVKDARFKMDDIGRSLRELSDNRWQRENESLASRHTTLQDYNRTLLVLFYGLSPAQVWQVAVGRTSNAYPVVRGFARGGAGTNTAWFFINKYHDSGKSVAELLPLAVHTLLMGKALDSTLIDGVQVLAYYSGAESLRPIVDLKDSLAKSREVDEYFAAHLLARPSVQ